MNEMENLYEEYKRLRDELSQKNINEVGAFELRRYRRDFENLHRRNLELQRSSRLSENVDEEELRQVLNLGDRMWRELGDTLAPVVEVIDIKMSLGKQIASERIHIKELKEANLRTLKTLSNQNKRFKSNVNKITDPELKAIFEEKLRVDEETIQKLKDLDASYDKRLSDLAEKLRTIALGGVLSELESTKKDSEGLSREEAEQLAGEMVDEANEPVEGAEALDEESVEENRTESEGLPGVEFEGVDPITPISANDDLTRGLDDPTETPVPAESEEEPVPSLGGDEPDEEPVPVLGGDEPEEEPVPVLGGDEPEEEPIPDFPVPPVPGESGEDPVPSLGGDEPEEEPVPDLDENPTDEDEEEEEEEDTPVNATVRQPKSKLWQKLQKVLEGAKVFLLGAIALHTGLMAGHGAEKVEANNNTDVVEETEQTTPEETTPEETTPAETTPEASTPDNTPVPTPSQPEAPSQPETPAEPTVSVGENDVVLNPGESVYDSQTGVEVGYTGVATQETGNGYVAQENRDLNSLSENTVVVTQDDLQPDAVQPELARTGQEVSEQEARSDMTQGEENNLDEAIGDIDWEAFFNDGPTL